MKFYIKFMAVLALSSSPLAAAHADPVKIGVSWANYQEERYKIEEGAMRAELVAKGATLVATYAQSSPSKQLSDVESLISQGVSLIVINAQDTQAIMPAVQRATEAGIPVIAYARVIESPDIFYIGFDNKEVGRMQAREIMKHAPDGNYAFIKGGATDPNANLLYEGAIEVLKPSIDSGKIKNVANIYTEGWLPANAQRNMEQILTANNNDIAAVIAANDGTAGGAIAALSAQGLAGSVPVSGQDGDKAAINRIALGTQTISVWQDVRVLGKTAADVALALAADPDKSKIEGEVTFTDGPKHEKVAAKRRLPQPHSPDHLSILIDHGWLTK